jgi:hypothetical protein
MFSPDLMRCAAARSWLPHFLLITFSSLWALAASAAPKTDIVYFKNGDKLTGEIRSLGRGRLNLNTDATGTIAIEWDKISGIVSDQHIQFETASGIRYFGSVKTSEKVSEIIVVTNNGPQTLDAERVIIMEPIEDRGIDALDIDFTVGYNFAKAGGIASTNLGVNMDWRSLVRIESLRFSTTITDSDTVEASKRMILALQHTRLRNNRWFNNAGLSFEKNDELGLNLRTSLSAGGGRYLVQSNSMLWSLDAGLQVSREDQASEIEPQVSDEDQVAESEYTDSLEATFTVKWDWFIFQDPDLDWSTAVQIVPSLTESGRVRGELDTSLQWEIINDLKWGFSLYGSFDNQPQSTTGEKSDYGINTTVTYEF